MSTILPGFSYGSELKFEDLDGSLCDADGLTAAGHTDTASTCPTQHARYCRWDRQGDAVRSLKGKSWLTEWDPRM